jgi:hypothetical protein
VTLILAGWTGRGADDDAERVYAPPISLSGDELPLLAGRHVYVFPFPYSAEILTREAQWRRYSLRVLAVERYPGAGDPPRLWLDERLYWFEQVVFNPLADQSLKLMTEFSPDLDAVATVDEVYARDTLIEHKTFWSYATFPFAEPTDLAGAP